MDVYIYIYIRDEVETIDLLKTYMWRVDVAKDCIFFEEIDSNSWRVEKKKLSGGV